MVIVFRDGEAKTVLKDSGVPIGVEAPPLKPRVQFGRIDGLVEGSLCGRTEMYRRGIHSTDRKGVSGNANEGADSIVVKSNDAGIGEKDSLTSIVYAATSTQGAGALTMSFENHRPIRVFRSSAGKSMYAPGAGPEGRVLYRYDGLYTIISRSQEENGLFLFSMERNPTMGEIVKFEEDENEPFELGTGSDATVFCSGLWGTQTKYLNEYILS